MKSIYYALIFALFLASCQSPKNNKSTYPQYTLKNLEGQSISIIKFKNRIQIPNQKKPILFLFIQPSCTECFKGIEHFERLYEEYHQRIDFIAILSDNQSGCENFKSEATALKQDYGLNFNFFCSIGEEDFLQSFQREGDRNFIALYDASLRLVGEYEGLIPEEMLELDLNRTLKTEK